MDDILIFPVSTVPASHFAVNYLKQAGIAFSHIPTANVTHLLLDVPSFETDQRLRDGRELGEILEALPRDIRIIGGNLNVALLSGFRTFDLLTDEDYLAQNAAITAECAIRTAAPLLKITFQHAPVLVIGWGRIGKCLARLLQNLGCDVTVAARKHTDRAILRSFGYQAINTAALMDLSHYSLIFNTVPEQLLSQDTTPAWGKGIKIDLASRKGMAGSDVVWARGLPGICAPDTSGTLIARTVLQYLKEEKV